MSNSRKALGLILLWPVATVAQYHRLPAFGELSPNQQRLLRSLASQGGAGDWNSLRDDDKATFYQITYVLERTPLPGGSLIDHVDRLEGILSGNQATHRHSNGSTATVDGWRIHVELTRLSLAELLRNCFGKCSGPLNPCQCEKDRITHSTHSVFGFTQSIRDYRDRRHSGPFLQIVLTDNDDAADLDVDKGRSVWEHRSSPKDVFERLVDRFPEVQRY
jgi:hypothetical protein